MVAASANAASPEGVPLLLRAKVIEPTLAPPPQPVAFDAQTNGAPQAQPDDAAPPTLETLVARNGDDIDNIDSDTECLAKVVHHEAANQPLDGQLAVAEVIVNRTHSARFPNSPCAVVNQRGQFFRVDAYHVAHTSPRWRTAVAIARIAEAGEARPVVPDALFFHAAYARPRGREGIIQIADQVFYR
jgi:spore germination cell wall hydrolase CwlJ-like protein